MQYMKNPMGIEEKSFEIIDEIVSSNGWSYPSEDEVNQSIFRRVIHTSADFDYLENLKIEPEFLMAFEKMLDQPVTVYTDTNMVLSGINKMGFAKTNWTLKCFVSNPDAKLIAEEQSITRSMASIQLACAEPGYKLFVLGNAPTAIFQILESIDAFKGSMIGVIGVPVGFVGAEESKLALYESNIPSITALGRKGGSNVAAAIVNALIYHYKGRL